MIGGALAIATGAALALNGRTDGLTKKVADLRDDITFRNAREERRTP